MKQKESRSKSVVFGWSDLIKPEVSVVPKGYYSAREIAREVGCKTRQIREKMEVLRTEGKVICVKVKGMWYYKK